MSDKEPSEFLKDIRACMDHLDSKMSSDDSKNVTIAKDFHTKAIRADMEKHIQEIVDGDIDKPEYGDKADWPSFKESQLSGEHQCPMCAAGHIPTRLHHPQTQQDGVGVSVRSIGRIGRGMRPITPLAGMGVGKSTEIIKTMIESNRSIVMVVPELHTISPMQEAMVSMLRNSGLDLSIVTHAELRGTNIEVAILSGDNHILETMKEIINRKMDDEVLERLGDLDRKILMVRPRDSVHQMGHQSSGIFPIDSGSYTRRMKYHGVRLHGSYHDHMYRCVYEDIPKFSKGKNPMGQGPGFKTRFNKKDKRIK